MVYQLQNLNKDEQQIALLAPAYVTVLISGADSNIEDSEIGRAIKLVHIKTFSENHELQELYKFIEASFESDVKTLIGNLPKDTEERNQIISQELERLNGIFDKIDSVFALHYYNSLKDFTHHIASAFGGVLGFQSVSPLEREFVTLPMLKEPELK